MSRFDRTWVSLVAAGIVAFAVNSASAEGIEGKSYQYETSRGHTGCGVFDPGGLLRFDVVPPGYTVAYGVEGTWTQFVFKRRTFFHGTFVIDETLYHYVGVVKSDGTVRGAVRDDDDYCLSYTAVEADCEPVPVWP